MPPPGSHKTLKPEQIALLRRWVKEGAQYQEHWAFIAPLRPKLPEFAANDPLGEWPRNDVDRFILAKLRKEHLTPSPEVQRHTWIRRVTYDLTGLPPTRAEVHAFVADASPDAYEKVVDRLLASPRYGEHRARYWLDVARYGDTHGLHADGYRSIWPYRDYVIKAYNENKPFDQFVYEQLAGDLLPAKNLDQLVATGFIRAGISSGEGGTLVEELQVNNQRERAEAFGAAFMGMTTGCAACHDHKFDPISQKDFYQLTAFFNNLTENPSNDDRMDWPPFVTVPKPDKRAAYQSVMAKRAEVRHQIDERRARAKSLVRDWISSNSRPALSLSQDGLQVRLRLDEQKGATFMNSAPNAMPARISATGGAPEWGEEVWQWPSMRMDTSTRIELSGAGDFDTTDAFSVGVWVMPRREKSSGSSPRGSLIARVDARQAPRGWELVYDEGKVKYVNDSGVLKPVLNNRGKLRFNLLHAGVKESIAVQTKEVVLVRGRWNHVLATYDGSGKASGIRLYLDSQPVAIEVLQDTLKGTIRTPVPLEFGRRYPDANAMRQSRYQDFRLYSRALSSEEAGRLAYEDYVAEILRRPMPKWSEQELKVVADFYFAERDEPTQALVKQLPAFDEELQRLSEGGEISLVCEEKPGLAYANVLKRGTYNQREERVRPGVPHFLPQLPSDAPLDRRGLAEWVVDGKNPLTARVTVNRMWQEVFGVGLVETTEDFGIMGARPSHPELLDWLALDFRKHAWDVKRFYRQLVLSATYRQSARTTPELLEKDPKNRWLARGPRFRMDAEMIRDTALAASGLLRERIGGPSVKPYQPPDTWESFGYEQDHGDALYRRSMYTFWKRMAPASNMDTLDAPMRDASCTRRQRTNTPLQALVTMNDPQWLEAARKLAERAIQEEKTHAARFDFIAKVLLARSWNDAELASFEKALGKFQATFERDEASAKALIEVGESPRDERIAPRELAPWTLVASAAMNLDDVLTK